MTRVYLFACLLACCLTSARAAQAPADGWVAAWAAAPDSAGPALKPQTIRQIVPLGMGGSSVRIRLSNLFGRAPLNIDSVHLALQQQGALIQSGTDQVVSFNGAKTVVIPAGGSVLSDLLPMTLAARQVLAVSMYLPRGAKTSTIHSLALQTGYAAAGMDATAAEDVHGTPLDSRYFLTDVEVAGEAGDVLVAVGDSITDGMGSAPDANRRWTDQLADRLTDHHAATIAVINSGIIGNRVLTDDLGPSAMRRFDRDVLDKPGVRWVLLEEGINDIGSAPPKVSAKQLIAGMQALIERTHARHFKIFGATLLPFKDSKFLRYTEAREATRQAVNQWIRSSGAFDGVADFDEVMRDPAQPDRLRPDFDSGDHTHPNEVGYRAMAQAVDLSWLAQDGERSGANVVSTAR
jgi:lysophospholipase L1-like esterase